MPKFIIWTISDNLLDKFNKRFRIETHLIQLYDFTIHRTTPKRTMKNIRTGKELANFFEFGAIVTCIGGDRSMARAPQFESQLNALLVSQQTSVAPKSARRKNRKIAGKASQRRRGGGGRGGKASRPRKSIFPPRSAAHFSRGGRKSAAHSPPAPKGRPENIIINRRRKAGRRRAGRWADLPFGVCN